MNAIEIFRSNYAEALLDALDQSLREPLSDPFAAEMIVVQGRGMAVWLSMQLAKRRGVWANAEFVYPKNFVRRAFAAALPEANLDADPFSRQRLIWEIMALLPKHLSKPVFAPLARYLAEDPDGTRQFQLSQRISETFDEYVTFRPELLRRWESTKGRTEAQLDLFTSGVGDTEHEAWQEALWLELVKKNGSVHNAALERRFQQALGKKHAPRSLPERVSIFGLSSLPPQYVRVLAALSTQTRVQLFLLSPSQEYYVEAIGRRESHKQSALQNSLLISYGTLGAELQEVIAAQLEARGVPEHAHDLYQDPSGPEPLKRAQLSSECDPSPPTVLERLQRDILHHQDGPSLETLPLPAADRSLSFHSCHSAIREVEVLHDQLLALMDGERPVKPDEIVVMTPNIDDYAALIQAVFERSRDDARFIPYRISDRSLQADSAVLDAFMRVLSLADSRAGASEVLDLLALAPVRERFKIAAGDVAQIAEWISASEIRWGRDGDHRASHNLWPDNQNTWEFGLQRLLMGAAVSSDDALCLGVLPFPEIEGSAASLLGRFAHFIRTLFAHLKSLGEPRSVQAWQATLTSVLAGLLSEDKHNARQHQQAIATFAELVERATAAGFEAELHLTVVRRMLTADFDQSRDARGFLSGGVTFCAMVPMRSIPFRVVCLLGMNDGAFPRRSHRADFNLIDHGSQPRQLGDPNRRVDDRYLFLEALLSARQRLVITFIGQSVRDNAQIPPSIVVTELLDYLVPQYSGPSADAQEQTRRSLITVHPLQPFSPRYFDQSDERLFSFEQGFLQGAKLLGPERRPATPLFTQPLQGSEENQSLALSDLLAFFSGPASYLLRRRLRVHLEEDELRLSDREPLELGGLDSYQAGVPVLANRLKGLTQEHNLELSLASGALPSGTPGVYEFERILRNAEPIAQSAELVRSGQDLAAAPFQLALDADLILTGELNGLWPTGQVSVQYSRIKGKHLTRSWIQHLVLCAQTPTGAALYSWLIGRPEKGEGRRICRFSPVESPLSQLRTLSKLFRSGQTLPLMWFPDSSLAFVKTLQSPQGDPRSALDSAGQAWKAERGYSRVLQRLYGRDSELTENGPSSLGTPPSPTFSEVARLIAEPLLEHLEEVS